LKNVPATRLSRDAVADSTVRMAEGKEIALRIDYRFNAFKNNVSTLIFQLSVAIRCILPPN
jgi:hypothetical protein